MHFLIFLWNTFARFIGFLTFIIIEIVVFNYIITVLRDTGLNSLANILTVVFIIWIILEILIKIFIGGGKTLLQWIFKF